MKQYIDKDALLARIKKIRMDIGNYIFNEYDEGFWVGRSTAFDDAICAINTLEVIDVDLELKIDNNNSKITVGTKIRSKANPNLILSIISNDCHENEFECSNGSVLSLKQIKKYYDIIK